MFTALYQNQITYIWKAEDSVIYALTIYICIIYRVLVHLSHSKHKGNIDKCLLLKSLSHPIPSTCMVGEILFGVLHISRITTIKNCLMTEKCSEYFLQ